MPLENTFRQLTHQLRGLRETLAALQVTSREDAPRQGGVMAVDAFCDTVDDCLGWIEESLAAAIESGNAVRNPPDIQQARLSLVCCHERFRHFEQSYFSELVAYERLRGLMLFSKSRGGEWLAWVKSVRQGLDQCAVPMDETSKSLLNCWQELAERVGGSSVSIQNNLGRMSLLTERSVG